MESDTAIATFVLDAETRCPAATCKGHFREFSECRDTGHEWLYRARGVAERCELAEGVGSSHALHA